MFYLINAKNIVAGLIYCENNIIYRLCISKKMKWSNDLFIRHFSVLNYFFIYYGQK